MELSILRFFGVIFAFAVWSFMDDLSGRESSLELYALIAIVVMLLMPSKGD